MAPPAPGSPWEAMLRNGALAGDGTQREKVIVAVNLERGVQGTPHDSWDAHNKPYEMQQRKEDTHTRQLRYELNVLCEYSNQQIVMDKSRGKPIGISNNVPTRSAQFQ